MSFGKIHGSFFDSSVNELDPIIRLVFIGMIVLSDRDGCLDVTRQALARKLNLRAEDVDRAISELEQPDPESRSRENDGRRLVPLDPSRSWGWLVVNKAQYRNADRETIAEENRNRKRDQRDRERKGSPCTPSQREEPTDTDTAVTQSHKLSRKERDTLFEEIWSIVPRKEEKPDARKWFHAHVETGEHAARIRAGVLGYVEKLKTERTEKRFWKLGNTLLRNAEGYIGWRPPADLAPSSSTGANWG